VKATLQSVAAIFGKWKIKNLLIIKAFTTEVSAGGAVAGAELYYFG
jgi:hypothetical protein